MTKPPKHLLSLVLAAMGALLAGCFDEAAVAAHDPHHTLYYPANAISIHQLAGRTGLRIVRTGAYSALLRNESNSVMIFAPPNSRAFVNGRPLTYSGGVATWNGTIFVPVSMVSAMRTALRSAPAHTIPAPAAQVNGTVVLDPGHGGRDPGAIAVGGMYEKDVVLPISLAVRNALVARGVKVVMTRADDRFIELDNRARIANRARPDLFVSIHADSARSRSARGYTLYAARAASKKSIFLAKRIDRSLAATGVSSRGLRRADYRVLVKTNCPAVLVEVGYLSNSAEARRLATDRHRQAIAEAIAAGVINSLHR